MWHNEAFSSMHYDTWKQNYYIYLRHNVLLDLQYSNPIFSAQDYRKKRISRCEKSEIFLRLLTLTLVPHPDISATTQLGLKLALAS